MICLSILVIIGNWLIVSLCFSVFVNIRYGREIVIVLFELGLLKGFYFFVCEKIKIMVCETVSIFSC